MGFDSSVNLYMLCKIESFLTVLTLKEFLHNMDSLVYNKIIFNLILKGTKQNKMNQNSDKTIKICNSYYIAYCCPLNSCLVLGFQSIKQYSPSKSAARRMEEAADFLSQDHVPATHRWGLRFLSGSPQSIPWLAQDYILSLF